MLRFVILLSILVQTCYGDVSSSSNSLSNSSSVLASSNGFSGTGSTGAGSLSSSGSVASSLNPLPTSPYSSSSYDVATNNVTGLGSSSQNFSSPLSSSSSPGLTPTSYPSSSPSISPNSSPSPSSSSNLGPSSNPSSSPSTAFPSNSFTLNIIHTGNCRARILPVDSSDNDCSISKSPTAACFNGIARRATFINQQRALYPNTLVLDTGNLWQGTSFSTLNNGFDEAQWLGQLGYDAAIPSTQDFFLGPAAYKYFIDSMSTTPKPITYLGSNFDCSREPSLSADANGNPYFLPWKVVPFNTNTGTRYVGLIGIIEASISAYTSTGNCFTNRSFTYDVWMNKAISQIKKAYPSTNIFVSLVPFYDFSFTHVGDVQVFVGKVQSGVTVVPTKAAGSYPTFFTNDFGNSIPFLATGDYCDAIGSFQITLDPYGNPISSSGDTVKLTNKTALQPAIWSSVVQANNKLLLQNAQVVGNSPTNIFAEPWSDNMTWGCEYSDCNMGRLVTSMFLDYCTDCDVAYTNSGGLRASINTSAATGYNITQGQVLTTLPFHNNIVTFTVPGPALYNAILYFASWFAWGTWAQWGNLRVAATFVTPANHANKQVVDFQIKKNGVWVPLDVSPTTRYKIATNNFVATNPIWTNQQSNFFAYGPDMAVQLVTYLSKNNPLNLPPTELLMNCSSKIYTVTPDRNGHIVWPSEVDYCLYILVAINKTAQQTYSCPNNVNLCSGSSFNPITVYPGGPTTSLSYKNISNQMSAYCSCSGLGNCSSTSYTCSCPYVAQTGPFAGILMIQPNDNRLREDCSNIRTQSEISSSAQVAMYVLSGITIAIAVLCSVFYIYNRNVSSVRRASPTFLHIINLASVLGAISAIFIANEASTSSCNVALWLGNIAFIFCFGSFIVKTYRIYKIFMAKELKVIFIGDIHLLAMLACMLLLEVLIRIVETSISFQSPTLQLDDNQFIFYYLCGGSYYSLFQFISIAYKLVLVAWAAFLSLEVRNLPSDYNEAHTLFLIIYHTAIVAGICIAGVFFLRNTNNVASTVLQCIGINYALSFVSLYLALSKYYLIATGEGVSSSRGTKNKNLEHSSKGPNQTSGIDAEDILEVLAERNRSSFLNSLKQMDDESKKVKLTNILTNLDRLKSDCDSALKLIPRSKRSSLFTQGVSSPSNNLINKSTNSGNNPTSDGVSNNAASDEIITTGGVELVDVLNASPLVSPTSTGSTGMNGNKSFGYKLDKDTAGAIVNKSKLAEDINVINTHSNNRPKSYI